MSIFSLTSNFWCGFKTSCAVIEVAGIKYDQDNPELIIAGNHCLPQNEIGLVFKPF